MLSPSFRARFLIEFEESHSQQVEFSPAEARISISGCIRGLLLTHDVEEESNGYDGGIDYQKRR